MRSSLYQTVFRVRFDSDSPAGEQMFSLLCQGLPAFQTTEFENDKKETEKTNNSLCESSYTWKLASTYLLE